MSHKNQTGHAQEAEPADSKADTFAIFALILIAVITTVYFVSGYNFSI